MEKAMLTRFDGNIRLNAKRELPVDPRNKPSLYFPGQRYTWEKAFFTVPDSVSEERVQFAADKYRAKYGYYLEEEGFTVLEMERPTLDTSVVAQGVTDPDRRRYVIWAKVARAPVVMHAEVPDSDVPLYLTCGYKLAD